MAIERWHEALESYQKLTELLDGFTLVEVLDALSFESATLRRKALMCRLLKRAVRLKELEFKQELVEAYFNGETTICSDG